MSGLTALQLQQLIGLNEYEQNLVIDRLSRELDLPSEQIRAEIDAIEEGKSSKKISAPLPEKKSLFGFKRKKEKTEDSPTFIEDSSKFRFGYDPSHEGKKRQEQVSQAILCPSCSAPLGIPQIRPINVTCPACGVETTFEN
ncbi:MAG: hypothetical protein P8Q35_01675 [Candidatus Thalassarchaeaceae archaeon]|jgi:hypothetical protein|nr:hypothetical protein [Candidatus Thalassarchaeaceae archaeon]